MFDNRELDLSPDSVILLKKHHPHRLMDKRGHSMLIFVVYFRDLSQSITESAVSPLLDTANPLPVPYHYASQIKRSLRQMIFEQESKPLHFEIALEQCLESILLQLYRVRQLALEQCADVIKKPSHVRVKETLEFLRSNYYLSHSLSSVARSAGLSQRQFSNICLELTGSSFKKFLNSARTTRARYLIETTQMPVSAIAFEVGFEELSTFYRAFQKNYGQSPLAFRTGNKQQLPD